jgi:putative hydrolase of the HAD superfamily
MDITVSHQTTVVFDLDDTLYNEIDFLISAYKEIAKQLNPINWTLLYINMFSRYKENIDVFHFLSEEYNIPKKELVKIYRNHVPTINLKSGVLPLLKKIKNKKGKIAIITDGRTVTQRQKIKSLSIEKYLDTVIISEDTSFEKPHTNNFSVIENKFNSTQYYYIGDNLKKDFIAPNQLGWRTIGLINGGLNIHYDSYKYLDKNNLPQDFIFSFKDLNII